MIYNTLLSLIEPSKIGTKQEFHKQLTNLKKLLERESKKKDKKEMKIDEEEKNQIDLISIYTKRTIEANKINQKNEIEDLLDDSDLEEVDFEINDRKGMIEKNLKSGKESTNKNKPFAWLKENDSEDPLNLLDDMAIKNVLASKPLTQEQIKLKNGLNKRDKNRGFKINQERKLIINDKHENDGSDEDIDTEDNEFIDNKSSKLKKKQKKNPRNSDIDEMMDTLSLSKISSKSIKTNNLVDDYNERNDFSYRTGGAGIHRSITKESSLNNKKVYGEEFKSKKARGDIKLKGKPDPFAYLPFNFNKLNRRKKAKLQGEFKDLIKHNGKKVLNRINIK